MKKLFIFVLGVFSSTQAFAGNLVEPMMEPDVVEAATTGSDGGLLIPILLLVFLVAAASGGGTSTPPMYPE